MEKTKRTRTSWLTLVRDWELSGQSQRTYCASHGLKLGTFSYWRSQYLHGQERMSEPVSGFTSLIPSGSVGMVKLRLGGLEVELSSEASFVADVLLRLSAQC